MRRFTREEWDGRKTLVVRRSFKGAGRTFAPGDAFEWKRYGVEPRRVRQLYEAGFLDHEDAPVFTAQPGAKRWSIQAERVEVEAASVAELEVVAEPEQATEQVTEQAPDDLDGLNRNELWEIADCEGAPRKLRADEQREAIRANRAETNHGTLDA